MGKAWNRGYMYMYMYRNRKKSTGHKRMHMFITVNVRLYSLPCASNELNPLTVGATMKHLQGIHYSRALCSTHALTYEC